jgi:hypothetical protein
LEQLSRAADADSRYVGAVRQGNHLSGGLAIDARYRPRCAERVHVMVALTEPALIKRILQPPNTPMGPQAENVNHLRIHSKF